MAAEDSEPKDLATEKRRSRRNTSLVATFDLKPLLPPLLDPNGPWYNELEKHPSPKEYTAMCRELFTENLQARKAAATALGKAGGHERLLYMNFKSHTIFAPESRRKLFETVLIANPDLVCLSEALVPVALAERSGSLVELQVLDALADGDKAIVQPFDGENRGDVGPPLPPVDGAAMAADGGEAAVTEKPPPNLSDKFRDKKLKEYDPENMKTPKSMEVGWFKAFLDLGFNWIVFVNPQCCPYGNNWGNCIVMKDKPCDVRCGHLTCHSWRPPWEVEESRCYVGVRHKHRITVSTHFDDTPAGNGRKGEAVIPRHEQAKELGEICKAWMLEPEASDKAAGTPGVQPRSSKLEGELAAASGGAAEDEDIAPVPCTKSLTLVGDLNAINPATYEPYEREILDRHNRGNPCPTDAVDALNEALGSVSSKLNTPLNRNKFECRFNKTVTHGYSNWYTQYLDMLTDATDFDHQPLLLYRPVSEDAGAELAAAEAAEATAAAATAELAASEGAAEAASTSSIPTHPPIPNKSPR